MAKFSPKARRKSRTLIVQALYQWQLNEESTTDVEAQFRAQQEMLSADVEYFSEGLRYVLANIEALDKELEPCCDIELDQIDPIEHAILWLAAYELKQRIDLPYKVVINEAVEQAKQFGATDGHKFINGTLDKLSKTLRKLEVESKA